MLQRRGRRQAVVEDKDDFSLSLSLSLSLSWAFPSLGSLSPFPFDEWWEDIFFRTITEKSGLFIVTTIGFPLQVSFAHQLEKSNLGAIKVWNLEPQTEKKPKKETKSQK